LASTSIREAAAEILACCLGGEPVSDELLERVLGPATGADAGAAAEASRALFRDVAEALADRFEPALCNTYADLFSRVIAFCEPAFRADELLSRYGRIRTPKRFQGDGRVVREVFVLSRVTLGADVAITSIILDAAKKRFPGAEIYFAGSRKAWELFAGDARIQHVEAGYRRGGPLRECLAVGLGLRGLLSRPGAIVIDPDSRLTQLGLLPVCPEQSYYFFESRAYGGDGIDSLSRLTKRWVAETFGVVDALPYIAPAGAVPGPDGAEITVSFGVGENPRKRIAGPFEAELLRELLERGLRVVVDKGAGGEEAERVERAIGQLGSKAGRIETWDGAFAPFAARIARSRLYVGYDSAGQHVAAAAKVPLVSVFAGFPSPRFLARWRPEAPSPVAVIRAEAGSTPEAILKRTVDSIDRLLKIPC